MEIDRKKIENSLDVVGEFFGDIKEACLKGHYKIDTQRLTDTDEIIRCIKLYTILKGIEDMTGRKQEVLVYYLLLGYSSQTKKEIIKRLKITDCNLNNINHSLRKMGLINLVGPNHNQAANEVNKDLLQFKRFIVDNEGSYVLMKIK